MSMKDWVNDVCGSEPPPEVTDENGKTWTPGDCWCTLPPGHPEPKCICQPCTDRFGAPGWVTTQEGTA